MEQLLFIVLACVSVSSGTGYYQRPRQQDIQILINTGESRKMLSMSQNLLYDLLHHVSVSPGNTRVGIISYDKDVHVHCLLNDTVNRESIIQSLQNLRLTKTKRNKLHLALHKAERNFEEQKRHEIYETIRGHYKISYKMVPQYIIIFDHIYHIWRLSSRRKTKIRGFQRLHYLFTFELPEDTFFARYLNLYLSPNHYRIRTKWDADKALRKAHRTPAFHGIYGLCRHDKKYQHDECKRRCVCHGGRLVNCYRVRREFTQLSIRERIRYINAFLAITSLPELSVRFNPFTRIHMDFFCSGIHAEKHFLPWHRWYVLAMENQLRSVDCRLTAVYWDWSYWHGVAWQSGIHIWGNKPYQLGSDGRGDKKFCVRDGPFAYKYWKTPKWDRPLVVLEETKEYLAYATHRKYQNNTKESKNLTRCLRRRFNTRTPTIAEVEHALSQPAKNFSEFERLVRENFHNGVHNAIGGHMCTDYASLSPEFFMHHGILDKIWYLWQKRSLDRKYAFFQNHTNSMLYLTCPYSPSNLIDSSRLPNHVKVMYSRFPSNDRSRKVKKDWVWLRGGYQHYRISKMHTKLIPCDNFEKYHTITKT